MAHAFSAKWTVRGAVLFLAWMILLRPTSFEDADGNVDDGPEPDALPWNTILRDTQPWQSNGTNGLMSGCSHGWCPISLRTAEPADGARSGWQNLYWRAPWSDSGAQSTTIDAEDANRLAQAYSEEHLGPRSHRISTATYHHRDPTFDLSIVAASAFMIRVGIGGDRARPAAIAWASTAPIAPFIAPFTMTILTPFFPSLLIAVAALGVHWTWQKPRVQAATTSIFEAAAILVVLGFAMMSYYAPAPHA